MKWGDPRTSNAMWVPLQHSLPLQELSLRQMGHREWCPPLQLQKPAMLFQQTGHIKRNDLDTCTPLSLIPGPSWLSISSFVFADLVAISFPGGKIAVTIGRCPLHSIAWLQGKLPLSFGILRILQEFKSQKWSSSSQGSLSQSPKYVWIQVCPQLSTGLWRLHRILRHIALSGAFRNLPRKRLGDVIPSRYWLTVHKLRNKRALWEHSRPKVAKSRDKKKKSRTWCCSQKEKNGTYKYILEIRGVRGHFVSLHNVPCLCRSCHFCKWVIQSDVFS